VQNEKYKVVARTGTEHSHSIVILLHGFGANGHDLAPLADMLDPERTLHFIFPEGPKEVPIGPHMTGNAWFELNMQEVEAAMAAGTYRSYVDDPPVGFEESVNSLRPLIVDYAGRFENLILGGFSQGGMVASHLALTSDIEVKKLILMSTTLVNKETLQQTIGSGKNLPTTFLSHGDQDPILSPEIAREFATFLGQKGVSVESHFFQGGHEIPYHVAEKLKAFILTPN